MKINNKGLTLVELMVCIVIFAVVLAAAFGFMLAAARSYTRTNDQLEIQRKSQSAMSLCEEYIIDCNTGIYVHSRTAGGKSSDELYILNTLSNGSYTLDVLYLDAGKLKYCPATSVTNDGNDVFSYTIPKEEGEHLPKKDGAYDVTDKVVSFKVEPEYDKKGKALSVKLTLGMEKGSASYECSQDVAPRNRPDKLTVNSDGEFVLAR